MLPFPSDEVTPPVTKIYLVWSVALAMIPFFLLVYSLCPVGIFTVAKVRKDY